MRISCIKHLRAKSAAFAGLLLIFSFSIFGQTKAQAKPGEKQQGGFGYFSLTAGQANFSALNKSLTANGYKEFNPTGAAFGGGGMYCFDNLLVGGSGSWLSNQYSHNSTNNLSLKGSYGFFNLGYILYSGKQSVFYPSLGVGGGGYELTITDKNVQDNFSHQLSSPAGVTTTKAGGLLLNIELSWLCFLTKHEKHGLCLGLKAGCIYSPNAWQPAINNVYLTNSPAISMNGFYSTIVIGGGGLFTKKSINQ